MIIALAVPAPLPLRVCCVLLFGAGALAFGIQRRAEEFPVREARLRNTIHLQL